MRRVYCESLETELNLPDRCERIISFSPAITEALFLMGLGDKIVGVSAFCVRPKEAREKQILGSYSKANLDKIRSLKPDIIFTTTGYQREFAKNLSKEFNVFASPLPTSISGIVNLCHEVGLVAGYYEEARKLQYRLLNEINKVKPSSSRLKVYIEIDFGMPVTFGAYSYITDAINFLGHINIFQGEASEWLEPDFRAVIEREPDVILYEPKMFSEESKEDILRKFEKRGWSNLKALKEGKLYVTPGPYDFLAHHGPSFIIEALNWLNNTLNLRNH